MQCGPGIQSKECELGYMNYLEWKMFLGPKHVLSVLGWQDVSIKTEQTVSQNQRLEFVCYSSRLMQQQNKRMMKGQEEFLLKAEWNMLVSLNVKRTKKWYDLALEFISCKLRFLQFIDCISWVPLSQVYLHAHEGMSYWHTSNYPALCHEKPDRLAHVGRF